MPKKGKKGKKDGKGKKVKGKGKGKGKSKGAEKKALKKENAIKQFERNAKIWQARLELSEASRFEFRETAKKLVVENDSLQDMVQRTEKDTIDVISFLKKQDQEKDDEIYKLNETLKELKRQSRKEKETIINDLSHQITQLEENLASKINDIQLMQNELKTVKEFRKKRAQMQKELDEIKEALFFANKENKDNLTRMEQKFFDEKMRLQQEANQKIAELAERAHLEAIANLDETTRSVYKENVRLNEALSYHMAESEELKKKREKLKLENETFQTDKELSDKLINEKVQENGRLKKQLLKVQEKNETLEKALSHVTTEFSRELDMLQKRSITEQESARQELEKVQRLFELRSKEMARIKLLARNILHQRSEMERFFHESLDYVRQEIRTNQSQYLKDAQIAYNRRMIAAHSGEGEFPPVRTFKKMDKSTNSVFRDIQAAETMLNLNGKVDIGDLTWEQKERVIRYLFARMNGASAPQNTSMSVVPLSGANDSAKKKAVLPSIQGSNAEVLQLNNSEPYEEEFFDETFVTQQVIQEREIPLAT